MKIALDLPGQRSSIGLEMLCSFLISLRSLSNKSIPRNTSFGTISIFIPVFTALLSLSMYPLFWQEIQATSNEAYLQIFKYSSLNCITQTLAQYLYSTSENVAITSAILSLHIVFTLLLDSVQKGFISASIKQIFGVCLIMIGVTLSKK